MVGARVPFNLEQDSSGTAMKLNFSIQCVQLSWRKPECLCDSRASSATPITQIQTALSGIVWD
jgi:hypothetical protein